MRIQRIGVASCLGLGAVLLMGASVPADLRKPVLESNKLLLHPIPDKATLRHFVFADGRTVGDPNSGPLTTYDGKPYTMEITGWILSETPTRFTVMDVYGTEVSVAKEKTQVTDVLLSELVRQLGGGEGRSPIDPRKPLGYEEWPLSPSMGLSIAAILTARLALLARDEVSARALFEQKGERSWREQIRDSFATEYQHQLVMAFSRRDYARANEIATHLLKPQFVGAEPVDLARKLKNELAKRSDDFKSFRLPTQTEWAEMGTKLSRSEQLRYLASRLRLLNCWQNSQPGGISYECWQFSDARRHGWKEEGDVINPLTTLAKMDLDVSDIEVLAPFLLDESYMLAFSFGRDFAPGRMLHQANWALAGLLNKASGRDLARLQDFEKLDAKDKAKHVEEILAWCKAHQGASHDQLLLETLRTTTSFGQLNAAASDALSRRLTTAVPILVERIGSFPEPTNAFAFFDMGSNAGTIAGLVHAFGTPESVAAARSWLTHADWRVRFWSALTLLQLGDKGKLEGLDVMREVVPKDKEMRLIVNAIDPLLALKRPEALAVTESMLDNPEWINHFWIEPILQRLVFAGSVRARRLLDDGLNDERPATGRQWSVENRKGPQENNEEYVRIVTRWRDPVVAYDYAATPEVRRSQRRAILEWLAARYAEADAGKEPAIRLQKFMPVYSSWDSTAPRR